MIREEIRTVITLCSCVAEVHAVMRKMIAELEKTECSPVEMAVLEKAKIELFKSKHEFGEALKRTGNGVGDIKWLMAETGWDL